MLVYGHDEQIAEWVALKLGLKPFAPGLYKAIGIIEFNTLIAGIVYSNYHEDINNRPLLIEMTIATIDKRWCSRHNLKQLFLYPFIQLNVKRVQATCGRKAKRTRHFLQRLGFQFEGIIRQGHPLGGDAAHYSMLKHECVWLTNGKKLSISASGTRSVSYGGGPNKEQPANCAL